MIPICYTCERFNGDRKCGAFKRKDIPDKIWEIGFNHRKPYQGDNGIRYLTVDKKDV